MAYIVNTVHGQGFARIFATDSFMVEGSNVQSIKEKGLEIFTKFFDLLNQQFNNNV